jgi:glucuronoarabinoxylan endo-1,4-beta-xylanase
MKPHQPLLRAALLSTLVGLFTAALYPALAASVNVQAESGTLGAEYSTNADGSTLYIYPTTTSTNGYPGSAARIATYTVVFPQADTYKLYARLRVGAGAANDDSFLYGNGFGAKSPTAAGDWILANNLNTAGYTASGDIVTGNGSAGNSVWKWVNLSEFSNGGETPITFTVAAGNLTNTFQIGAREDGLDIDSLVFGSSDTTFTVGELDGNGPQPPVPASSTINWTDVHQRIDGFGASSAWRSTWGTALADLLFSTNTAVAYTDNLGQTTTNTGVGLSILRTRIAPGATSVETNIMKLARDRGAIVWSAPWSPAANFKSNTNVNGGSFVGNAANYQAYATQLAGYVSNMKNQHNVNLYAVSVQNEPDANITTYESCNWTAQQIHDFVPYLYNALVATNCASTRIVLPESQNWPDYQNLADTAMNDASVAAMVGVVANHNYDGNDGPTTLTQNSFGKPFWETEVSILSGSDSSINNGVYYAKRIHLFLTVAEVNAWHYWWLVSGNTTGNQGLLDNNGSITKRLFTHGNFSRFVRPGFYRIGATRSAYTLVSAYKDPQSSAFAVVVINTNSSVAVDQTINLTGFGNVSSVTPWVTSASLSLASRPSVAVTNLSFFYSVPAMSVVTFVGQATTNAPNTAPTFTPVPDQVVDAGTNLSIPNVATDPEVPATQTLTYSLLSGPVSAQVDAASGVFTWRPLVSQANSVNPVSIQVADNGAPVLRATNNFTLTVNPLAPSSFTAINLAGGQVDLAITGPAGPDYTLRTSTNLLDWTTVVTSNSPALPLTLIDTNTTDGARFYRLQLGP